MTNMEVRRTFAKKILKLVNHRHQKLIHLRINNYQQQGIYFVVYNEFGLEVLLSDERKFPNNRITKVDRGIFQENLMLTFDFVY